MSTLRRVGLVLAGGLSTRLANKVLLPIEQRKLCIESALQFCKDNSCHRTVVVVQPNTILPLVLNRLGWDAKFVVQQEARGVIDAIITGTRNSIETSPCEYLIAFGDNVYAHDERVPFSNVAHAYASVRRIKDTHGRFTKYCPESKAWYEPHLYSPLSFCGWILLPKNMVVHFGPSMEMHKFLQHNDVLPYISQSSSWYDIGTPEAYAEYVCTVSL